MQPIPEVVLTDAEPRQISLPRIDEETAYTIGCPMERTSPLCVVVTSASDEPIDGSANPCEVTLAPGEKVTLYAEVRWHYPGDVPVREASWRSSR